MTTPTPEQRKQLRQRGAAAVMWLIWLELVTGRKTMFVLKWQNQETKETGQGDPHPSREYLNSWAEEMNREFPDIKHWVEPVPESRVPGLGAFKDWSGVNIEGRK